MKSVHSKLIWIAVCGSVFFTGYYWHLIHQQPNFKDFKQLKQIDNKTFDHFVMLHHSCFEEARRENLINYLMIQEDQPNNPLAQAELKNKVDQYIQVHRKKIKKDLRSLENATLVWKGKELAGFYSCHNDSNLQANMIFNLCVSKKERGKGLGQLVVKHAIKRCQKLGLKLGLTVYKNNTIAIALYKKLGFVISTEELDPDNFSEFNKFLMIYQPASPN